MALNKEFGQSLNKVLKAVGLKPLSKKEDVEELEHVLKGMLGAIKSAVKIERSDPAGAADQPAPGEKPAESTKPPTNGGGKKSPTPKKTNGNGGDKPYGNKFGQWDQAEEDKRQVILAWFNKTLGEIPEDRKQEFYDWKKSNKMGFFDDMFLSKLRIVQSAWQEWIKANINGDGEPATVGASEEPAEDDPFA